MVYYYLVRWAWLMNHTLTKFSQLNLSSSTVLLRPKTARIALSLSGVNNQPMLKYSSTTAVDTLYVSMRCFYVTTHARRGRDVVTMTKQLQLLLKLLTLSKILRICLFFIPSNQVTLLLFCQSLVGVPYTVRSFIIYDNNVTLTLT